MGQNKEELPQAAEQYLETVLAQVRCQRLHTEIREELLTHLEEQAADLMEAGRSRTEAWEEAVAEMGDPVETGTGLDRVHRPRMDWRSVAAVSLLTLLGVLLQALLGQEGSGGWKGALAGGMAGIGVMLVFCYLDYTVLARAAVRIYLALCAGILLGRMANLVVVSQYDVVYFCALILIPIYGGCVFTLRNRGWKGILAAFLLLALGCLSILSVYAALLLAVTGLLVLAAAVAKGCYAGVSRRAWMAFPLFGVGGGSLLVWYYLRHGAVYQIERLCAWLGVGDSALSYQQRMAGVLLGQLRILGETGQNAAEWMPGLEREYLLLGVMDRYGILAGILLCLLAVLLLIRMGKSSLGQSNLLGMLTGLACGSAIALGLLFHVLMSLGLLPPAGACFPFVSSLQFRGLGFYAVLGVYLSVYRNTGTVPHRFGQRPREAEG